MQVQPAFRFDQDIQNIFLGQACRQFFVESFEVGLLLFEELLELLASQRNSQLMIVIETLEKSRRINATTIVIVDHPEDQRRT